MDGPSENFAIIFWQLFYYTAPIVPPTVIRLLPRSKYPSLPMPPFLLSVRSWDYLAVIVRYGTSACNMYFYRIMKWDESGNGKADRSGRWRCVLHLREILNFRSRRPKDPPAYRKHLCRINWSWDFDVLPPCLIIPNFYINIRARVFPCNQRNKEYSLCSWDFFTGTYEVRL